MFSVDIEMPWILLWYYVEDQKCFVSIYLLSNCEKSKHSFDVCEIQNTLQKIFSKIQFSWLNKTNEGIWSLDLLMSIFQFFQQQQSWCIYPRNILVLPSLKSVIIFTLLFNCSENTKCDGVKSFVEVDKPHSIRYIF